MEKTQGYYLRFSPQEAIFPAFMTDTNLNYWGLLAVPVGVSICFGLALLVWLREEFRAGSEEKKKKSESSSP
jgi:hypothetical protein